MIIADKRAFCQEKLKINLDKWQDRLINDILNNKNVVARCGRQVGKSTAVAVGVVFYALENPGKTTMVIAASQRQAGELYNKIQSFLINVFPEMLDEDPTLTRLILTNKHKIYCLPAGRTGWAIRCYTIDKLVVDEAAFVPEAVWNAVTPMLSISKGTQVLLSTPFGVGGYFYEKCRSSNFIEYHIDAEKCPRHDKKFLVDERKRMGKITYAQEYKAEFVTDVNQFYPPVLIKRSCTFLEWHFKTDYNPAYRYYLGVDVARYGGDENVFAVCEMRKGKYLKIVKVLTTARMELTDTTGRIKALDDKFHFAKIFIDPGGIGAGVLDPLIEYMGRRVVGLDNATKSIDKEAKRQHKILDEDMHSNLLVLMETKKIEMIDKPELKRSLDSVKFKYTSYRNLVFYGNYTHIAEAVKRAAWCIKAKGLKVYVA